LGEHKHFCYFAEGVTNCFNSAQKINPPFYFEKILFSSFISFQNKTIPQTGVYLKDMQSFQYFMDN